MPRRTIYPTALTILMAMAAAALLAVLVSHNNPASAQSTTTIKVNTTEDESNAEGDCSLREAIEAANTNAAVDGCKAGSVTEEDVIRFALGKKKATTIVLGSQLPTITDPSGLTIDGQKKKITVSGNDAVRVFEVGEGAKLTLARMTVAEGNSPDFGGGIFNGGTLTVLNSTFSGNSAEIAGGGLANGGTLTVTNSTFSGNNATFNGGGIFSRVSAILSNTIMANSPSGGNCAVDLGTTITDGGYNIDDANSCGFSTANNSLPSTNPLLNPKGLQKNGGPTQTIQLLKGSPARNAIPKGANGCGTEIKEDQRGVKRPKGGGCEIGAVEGR